MHITKPLLVSHFRDVNMAGLSKVVTSLSVVVILQLLCNVVQIATGNPGTTYRVMQLVSVCCRTIVLMYTS